MSVQGRVALVTGGAQGIGRAIAGRLAADGARVGLVDVRGDAARAAAAELEAAGGAALGLQADLRHKAEVQRAVEEVARWGGGRVDILVNNVGIIRDNYLTRISEEDWDAVLETNLKTCFLASQAVVPGMMERKFGRIISIASRAWLGNVGQSNYSASKGGIVSLTRTFALELGKFGITANCVAPGVIDTPMYRGLRQDVQERLLKAQPIQRIGTPDDVANAVAFFASDRAWYVTGQVLYVCGGKSLASVIG